MAGCSRSERAFEARKVGAKPTPAATPHRLAVWMPPSQGGGRGSAPLGATISCAGSPTEGDDCLRSSTVSVRIRPGVPIRRVPLNGRQLVLKTRVSRKDKGSIPSPSANLEDARAGSRSGLLNRSGSRGPMVRRHHLPPRLRSTTAVRRFGKAEIPEHHRAKAPAVVKPRGCGTCL